MPARARVLAVASLVVGIALPVGGVLASLRTSNNVIVTPSDVVAEDLYAFGGRTIIEGRVEGDLFVITGDLQIAGEVTGDVVGLVGGPARISGTVGGSIRLAAVRLEVGGTVGDDVAAVTFDATVAADVGRDLLAIAGDVVVGGRVGRDVLAQVWSLDLRGEVVHDVDARVSGLTVGDGARIGGDLTFKASGGVSVDPGSVGGLVSERAVISPVWAKAVARAIAWLSLLGFVVGGVALFWLFRRTTTRAVAVAAARPWRSAGIGLLMLLAPPAIALPLGVSLVGLPVALLVLVVWLVALVLGPAPAVAAVGARLLGGRGGAVGGLVVGAFVWRGAIWLLSLVGALVYLTALVVGLGSFALAGWEGRRAGADDWRPLPPAVA